MTFWAKRYGFKTYTVLIGPKESKLNQKSTKRTQSTVVKTTVPNTPLVDSWGGFVKQNDDSNHETGN